MSGPSYLIRKRATSAVTSAQIISLPLTVDSHEHSMTIEGGCESCTITARVDLPNAYLWLEELQDLVEVYDRHGALIWGGYIETVEIDDGVSVVSSTIGRLYNEVYATYTVNGKQTVTPAATNSTSMASYGRHMMMLNVGEIPAAAATGQRDRFLNLYAFPKQQTTPRLGPAPKPGTATVTLRCRGWFGAVGWVYLNVPGNGTLLASSEQSINSAISYACANATYGNNFGLGAINAYTGVGGLNGNFTFLMAGTRGLENMRDYILRMLGYGSSTGARVVYGFGFLNFNIAGRRSIAPTAMYTKDWAGATPTTLQYYLRGNRLYSSTGYPIPLARIRPDTMGQMLISPRRAPLGGTDGAGRFYITRVTYRWDLRQGESADIETDGGDTAESTIAQVRG